MVDLRKIIRYAHLWRKGPDKISLLSKLEGRENARKHWFVIVVVFFGVVFVGGIFDIRLANKIKEFADKSASLGVEDKVIVIDREIVNKAMIILKSRETEARNRLLSPAPVGLN